MKGILTFLVLFSIFYDALCQSDQELRAMITSSELAGHLNFIASDELEGRGLGTRGEKLAALYLASYYSRMGLSPAFRGSDFPDKYYQAFTVTKGKVTYNTQNVTAFIEGTDPVLGEEIIIIGAHYDHLGTDTSPEGDSIYNGAADDGSGTAALLEIAESFAEARRKGVGPKRSLLFLHTSGEEAGLFGSQYFMKNLPFPRDKIRMYINMDGLGGKDPKVPQREYIYIISNDSTSKSLIDLNAKINSKNDGIELIRPGGYGWSSDQKVFEGHLIPSIYYSTGLTEHYHQVSDEVETIDFETMEKVARLVFSLAWHVSTITDIGLDFDRSVFTDSGKFVCRPCGCNMHDEVFEEAGNCPECNMPLIPQWIKE